MDSDPTLDKCHIEFLAWSQKQGVKINGSKAVRLPGRGLGLLAERKIKV